MSKGLVCPHCEHKYTSDDHYNAKNDVYAAAQDEERFSEICPVCKTEFWIQAGYVPIYEMFKTEEEMEE